MPGEPVSWLRRATFAGLDLEGSKIVKKALILAALGAGAFAVWRKIQADRAEIDLWTEATTGDES